MKKINLLHNDPEVIDPSTRPWGCVGRSKSMATIVEYGNSTTTAHGLQR